MTTLKERWQCWHNENPQVWNLFERFTKQAIQRGHTRLSAWLIVNRIRWETSVETTGKDFKISNNYVAFYSRHFMEKYPQYEGFFVTKRMKEE